MRRSEVNSPEDMSLAVSFAVVDVAAAGAAAALFVAVVMAAISVARSVS